MNSRLAVACLLVSGLMAAAPEQTLEELFAQSQAQFLAGDYLLARDGFGKVWQEFAKTRGEHDALTTEARIFYGQVLTMTGNADKALTVLGPVSSGNSHNAMVARAAFALALRESGQLEKATKILKELARSFPPTSPENLVHLGRIHAELAVCQSYLGHFREAEANAREALRLHEISGHPVPGHHAAILAILGQIYLLHGRNAEAYATLTRAREESRPLWRSSHPELAIVEGSLGVLAYRAGRYDEAETRTREALVSMEKLLGPDHPEVGAISRQMALVLKKRKRHEESKDMDARARQILDRSRHEPRISAWSWREVK